MKKKKQQKQQQTKQQIIKPSTPASIYSKGGETYIVISAKPNAKVSRIVSLDQQSVGVSLAAPPRDGQANAELIEFISHSFGLKKSSVSLDKGSKSRHKVIVIDGNQFSSEDAYQTIKQLIQ